MAKNAIELLKPENHAVFKKQAKLRSEEFSLARILPMYEELYRTLVK
jgi:hypothetical protein